MRVGSLFSGIGGLELGLERAGHEVVWQVEIDPFCRGILAKHWPEATRYEDVLNVRAANLDPVDLICGGFPCQDISIAGGGAGITGKRSGLWFEYARVVRELRPSYVLVENVPVLTSRGLDRVLGDLARAGYDAEWAVLSAAQMGAPHLRRRIFLLAYRRGLTPPNALTGPDVPYAEWDGAPEEEGWADEQPWVGLPGEVSDAEAFGLGERWEGGSAGDAQGLLFTEVPYAPAAGLQGPEAARTAWPTHGVPADPYGAVRRAWDVEPDVGRVVDGIPTAVDRSRIAALGNAVVPQVAEWIGRRLPREVP